MLSIAAFKKKQTKIAFSFEFERNFELNKDLAADTHLFVQGERLQPDHMLLEEGYVCRLELVDVSEVVDEAELVVR